MAGRPPSTALIWPWKVLLRCLALQLDICPLTLGRRFEIPTGVEGSRVLYSRVADWVLSSHGTLLQLSAVLGMPALVASVAALSSYGLLLPDSAYIASAPDTRSVTWNFGPKSCWCGEKQSHTLCCLQRGSGWLRATVELWELLQLSAELDACFLCLRGSPLDGAPQ